MAGLFGFFNFEKPGAGVDKPQKEEKPKKGLALFFTVFFRKFWKMVSLNFIYILCCIPIVTIGPATAALTYCLKCYAEGSYVIPAQDFWNQFKANFKQTFLFGIIDLFVLLSMLYMWGVLPSVALDKLPPALIFSKYLMIIPFIVYLFMRFYMYLIAVSFESTFFRIIMDSFLLALVGFYKNLYVGILCLILFAIHYFTTVGLVTILFYGFSMFGLLIVIYTVPVIEKYTVPEK